MLKQFKALWGKRSVFCSYLFHDFGNTWKIVRQHNNVLSCVCDDTVSDFNKMLSMCKVRESIIIIIYNKSHLTGNHCSCNAYMVTLTGSLATPQSLMSNRYFDFDSNKEISDLSISYLCTGFLQVLVFVKLLMASKTTCLLQSYNPSLTKSRTQVLIIRKRGSVR